MKTQRKLKTYSTEIKQSHDNDKAPSERFKNHGVDSVIVIGDKNAIYKSVQRVNSGIDQLLSSGRIDIAEAHSATRWCNDYEYGVHGAKWSEARVGGSSDVISRAKSQEYSMISRFEAKEAYDEASAVIGRYGDSLLCLFVHHGLSLRAVADKLGQPKQDTAGAVITVLKRLTEHYHEIDNRRTRRTPNKTTMDAVELRNMI
jgi:hypothetical protein